MEEVNLTESQYKQSNSPFTNPCLIEKLESIRETERRDYYGYVGAEADSTFFIKNGSQGRP